MSDSFVVNREELAWAAGFFDGEGYVAHTWRKNGGTGKRADYRRSVVQLDVPQTDPTVLERFKKAVGVGKVQGPYGPYDSAPNSSPHWYFRATSYREVQAIVGMLWTFLSPIKKEQARLALVSYNAAPVRRQRARVKKVGETL